MSITSNKPVILIVEDEALVARDLELRLLELGYKVSGHAGTGRQALNMLEATTCDLVLMDIVLKNGMDGIETAEIIRDQWHIPVIFLTGHTDSARLERAGRIFPFGFIVKPFQDRDLQTAIEMALYVARADEKRRKAEEAILESEKKFRTLFQHMTEGFVYHEIITDDDGRPVDFRFIEVNDAYLQMAGLAGREIIGRKATDVFPGINLDEFGWIEKFGRVALTGEPLRFEQYFRTSKRWFAVSAYSPVRGYFACLINEITTKKETESALRVNMEKYKALFESFPLGIFITGPQGDVLEANKASRTLLNMPASRKNAPNIHQLPWEMIRPDGSPMPGDEYPAIRALRENRPVENSEMGLINDEGEITWLTVTAVPIPLENHGVAIAHGDITARKKAGDELVKSENFLRKIFEVLPVGLWIADRKGKLISGNPKGVEIWGAEPHVGPEEYGIFKARRVPSGEEIQPEEWALAHTVNHETPVENEVLEIDAFDGRTRTIINFSAPVFDDGGSMLGAIVVNHDITELKKAEDEKDRLQAQLQHAHKMEAVGTLAGGIAHDFNNLLQAIYGYTQLILLETDRDSPHFGYLNSIQAAGYRAKELIRQLLLFSRKLSNEMKPLDLNRQLDQALGILKRSISDRIDLQTRPAHDLRPIKADPVQIEQVVLNLGGNAADAMPDGGKLLFMTENTVLKKDYPGIHFDVIPGRYVLLTVSDTGHGMDRETAVRVFEPFFTTKEIGKGTGLGLATVYGIVKSHGGFIFCNSTPGQGTTFQVYLPAVDRSDGADEEDLT